MNSKTFYTNPEIYPQIYHRTPCPTVLICNGVLKNKGEVGLFRISQRERLFISYDNQVL